ncbi:hypothetical protein ANN_17214 [Periplaneta americana]|uniref:Uncharacterized protein n=1 Tax=Periplaneta americana TaxID=6978 RepID=A0ABQ8SSB8_PERAM|nr:hypothetical protein ANN_17214 [Periplaneta americana]
MLAAVLVGKTIGGGGDADTGTVAAAGEDSDYYTPEDPATTILSPLHTDKSVYVEAETVTPEVHSGRVPAVSAQLYQKNAYTVMYLTAVNLYSVMKYYIVLSVKSGEIICEAGSSSESNESADRESDYPSTSSSSSMDTVLEISNIEELNKSLMSIDPLSRKERYNKTIPP